MKGTFAPHLMFLSVISLSHHYSHCLFNSYPLCHCVYNRYKFYIHRMKLSSLSSSSLCSLLGPPIIISSAKHVGVFPGILSMIPHFPHVFTKPTTAFKLLRSIIILAFKVLKKTLNLEAAFPYVSHGFTSVTRIVFSLSSPKNDAAGT